jgi:hypothetical protein
MGAFGLRSAAEIEADPRAEPMCVRGGPGPLLPLSPIRWQASQPDCSATASPATKVTFCDAVRSDGGLTATWFGVTARLVTVWILVTVRVEPQPVATRAISRTIAIVVRNRQVCIPGKQAIAFDGRRDTDRYASAKPSGHILVGTPNT